MRNNVVFFLSFLTVMLISGCTDEYDITVINKSSHLIIFEFTTGHRLGEYRLEPEGEWHYSLSKTLGHSMGTFKPLSTATVDYRYSDYVYTFYNAYTLAFDTNGGMIIKNEKEPTMTLTIVQNDKIQMPDCIWEKWNETERRYFIFNGWAEEPEETDEEKVYTVGSFYTVSENIDTHIRLYAQWE